MILGHNFVIAIIVTRRCIGNSVINTNPQNNPKQNKKANPPRKLPIYIIFLPHTHGLNMGSSRLCQLIPSHSQSFRLSQKIRLNNMPPHDRSKLNSSSGLRSHAIYLKRPSVDRQEVQYLHKQTSLSSSRNTHRLEIWQPCGGETKRVY